MLRAWISITLYRHSSLSHSLSLSLSLCLTLLSLYIYIYNSFVRTHDVV